MDTDTNIVHIVLGDTSLDKTTQCDLTENRCINGGCCFRAKNSSSGDSQEDRSSCDVATQSCVQCSLTSFKQRSVPCLLLASYAKFLTRFPYIIPIIVIGIVVGCGVYSMKKHPLPDFKQNPTKGFETRGTPIRARAWTLQNLYNHKDVDLFLVPNYTLALSDLGYNPSGLDIGGLFGRKKKKRSLSDRWSSKESKRREKRAFNGRFCTQDDIDVENAKFVLEATDSSFDLLSVAGIQSICRLESSRLTPFLNPSDCPMKSLPHFVTIFTGKSCDLITTDHVSHLRHTLSVCAGHFYNKTLTLTTDNIQAQKNGMPSECLQANYVIPKLFHFIFPIGFMETGNPNDSLHFVLSYVDPHAYPSNPSHNWMDFYKEYLHEKDLTVGKVRITAVNLPNHLEIKYSLFAEILLHDTVYFAVAAVLIVVIMVLYLRSLMLTLATLLNVGASFIFAYTIYHALPQTNFFSFLNLTTGLVLIAVGADDVFIFHDAWQQAKTQLGPEALLENVMARTLLHAALSVFVTSLSTSAAFFVNIISSITAIQCFGIFAGIAILCNFVLMITWTPSIIVLIHKADAFCVQRVCPTCKTCCFAREFFSRISDSIYGKWLPALISKAWFVWIFLLVGLGIGGCVVVFVTPQLQLPRMKDFQLFKSSNMLEHWNLEFEDKFESIVAESDNTWMDDIPLYFVWGFHPEDKGNHLDPDDHSNELNPDKDFDFYSEESQLWLENFCMNLTNSPLVKDSYRMATCTMEAYEKMLHRFCLTSKWSALLASTPCCSSMYFPFSLEQVEKCVPAAELLFDQQSRFAVIGEPIFNGSNRVVGFKMYVRSNFKMSMSYNVMDEYYKQIESYVKQQLESAPMGMKNMFFTSRYSFESFYDLQRGISQGTYYSIILSLVVAFVIMLLTSLNLLLTVYAIITIGFAIICTVGTIVLMGWDLNILESITISLAVGLSIDFTIHYGVAYRISPHHDNLSRMTDSFTKVGSAVAMAALTTFAAGAAMMPSSILAYTKLGIFLMLVMLFSWIYSTFLFQSICRIIGPKGSFCQIPCGCCQTPDKTDQHSLGSINSLDSYLVTF